MEGSLLQGAPSTTSFRLTWLHCPDMAFLLLISVLSRSRDGATSSGPQRRSEADGPILDSQGLPGTHTTEASRTAT